jgi:hypothetical protein
VSGFAAAVGVAAGYVDRGDWCGRDFGSPKAVGFAEGAQPFTTTLAMRWVMKKLYDERADRFKSGVSCARAAKPSL